MRSIGPMIETYGTVPADTMATAVLAATTGEAFDIPSGAAIMRITGVTTANGAYAFAVNIGSTQAVWPSADATATTNTTSLNVIVHGNDARFFQLPSGTTGLSLISATSGIVSMEFWSR